ncbi:MAG: hypothetical protein CME64_12920 [Halobacteriovoraceae bacterium]|nr:hypothetical protein [Halobacteriovoraceae bacterium]
MKKSIISIALLTLSTTTMAADWQGSSLSLLSGDDFAVGSDTSRTEITYENALGFGFGDSFFFLDVTNPYKKANSNYTTEMYGEWHPRFSIGKQFGLIKGDGLIKDVLFANTFEFGNNAFAQHRANLHGIGIDFNLPYFSFFQWNIYVRDNLDRQGTSLQSTFAYLLPFKVGGLDFVWNAYVDIVHNDEGEEGTETIAHRHTGQQLKLDVGALWAKPGKLYAGFEYQVWDNKFGIRDGDSEKNLKYMMQWQF